jgi:copper transport protein
MSATKILTRRNSLARALFKHIVRTLLVTSLIAVFLFSVLPVLAHGVIEKSEPAAGAAVAASPPEVKLWFTESVDLRFSSIEVHHVESARRVDRSDVKVNADRSVSVSLQPDLPRGAYRVTWRAYTPSDGHAANGQFTFGVGIPVDSQAQTTTSQRSLLSDAIRFLSLLGQALFMGIAVFRWAIRLEDEPRFDRATFWAAQSTRLALGMGWLGALYAQWQSVDAPLLDVLTTRWGSIWLMRLALLGVALFKINSLLRGEEKSGALLAGAFLLFTFSLTSHSAAKLGLLGAVIDWLHLLGTSIWSGGVLCAAIALMKGEKKFLPHFSILAIASVGLFVVSGLWLSNEQVGTWSGLLFTDYGRALLIKLAAAALGMGLGLVNALSPRKLFSLAESIIALMILFAAASLTNLPPAFSQVTDHAPTRIEQSKLNTTLTITPARAGTNTVQVRLHDAKGDAVTRAQVTLTFQPLREGLVSELVLNEIGNGLYSGAGINLTNEGEWQILVAINQRDYVNFDFVVAPDSSVRLANAPFDLWMQMVAWLNRYALLAASVLVLLVTALWSWVAWRSLPRTSVTILLWIVPGLLLAGVIWFWIQFNR